MRRSSLSALAARWEPGAVLKQDVLSTIERGRFATPAGPVDAIVRHLDDVPWWSRPLARYLMERERRALELASPLGFTPSVLFAGDGVLVRGWIDGLPLHTAQPHGDVAYFRDAKAALRSLHRSGICHNDLAKPQNWMRDRNGRACLIDFQLASHFKNRNKLFRIAAYEDLRHLLQQKRKFAESALTPSERRMLMRKSLATRVWMATGKKVYNLITRVLFRFADREGGGLRLIEDAPSIANQLKSFPGVRAAVVVAYPDRRAGTGLYAFVEASDTVSEQALLRHISTELGAGIVPEQLQVVHTLPRRPSGEVHTEVLQLVALNQIDLVDKLVETDGARVAVASIVDDRRNLRDRAGF